MTRRRETPVSDGDRCRHGKCECPRCRCGYALNSPGCEDYHRRHPYSKRGEK